jgi:hypothetical protein
MGTAVVARAWRRQAPQHTGLAATPRECQPCVCPDAAAHDRTLLHARRVCFHYELVEKSIREYTFLALPSVIL